MGILNISDFGVNPVNNSSANNEIVKDNESIITQDITADVNEEQETEKVVIETVEGEIVDSEDNYPDDVIFKTEQVAKFLNINAQTVRNYESAFADILHIERAKSDNPTYAARLYKKKDVKELRRLLALKKDNGWTNAELVKRLTEPSAALYNASVDSTAMENLKKVIQECVIKAVTEQVGVLNEQLLLSSSTSNENENKILEQMDALAKKMEMQEKEIEERDKIISELREQNQMIAELKEQNQILIEQTKKKKWSLFGK